jgi:acyl carrier protein
MNPKRITWGRQKRRKTALEPSGDAAANLPISYTGGRPDSLSLPANPAVCYRLRHPDMSEGENTVMASAAQDIVEMITGRISPASGALQLSEPLDKLGLDSMQVVELIFDIEEKFDINLPVNANLDIESKTVGDLIQAVEQLVAAKAKPN